jgi:hypothetical protein
MYIARLGPRCKRLLTHRKYKQSATMTSMFRLSWPSFLTLSSITGNTTNRPIDLPSVEIHDIEKGTDRRARRLKHLLKANHANFSVLYNHMRFDNHMPHVRSSSPASRPVFIFSSPCFLYLKNPPFLRMSSLDPRLSLPPQRHSRPPKQHLRCRSIRARPLGRLAGRDLQRRLERVFREEGIPASIRRLL